MNITTHNDEYHGTFMHDQSHQARIGGPVRVGELIDQYRAAHRPEESTTTWSVLADMIADMLHYATANNLDTDQVLRVARAHYATESLIS